MADSYHDIGGKPAGTVEPVERSMAFWERRVEAMRDLLARREVPLVRTDELRRSMETMGEEAYDAITFYERKTHSLKQILLEKGYLQEQELEARVKEICARRESALRALPQRFDHHHDHPDTKEDDAPSGYDVLSEALFDLLVAKGHLSPGLVSAMIERMENAGPANGARVVARAWIDPAYRERLLVDGKQALGELGIDALEAQIIVPENTGRLHNVIVCTLCSCYPRSVLGTPPAWYVSKPYRARTIREPRSVLAEFGMVLSKETEVRVHDSTADMRYMVLPMRPAGTQDWPEEKLAALVTRDSLIGVSAARDPKELDYE